MERGFDEDAMEFVAKDMDRLHKRVGEQKSAILRLTNMVFGKKDIEWMRTREDAKPPMSDVYGMWSLFAAKVDLEDDPATNEKVAVCKTGIRLAVPELYSCLVLPYAEKRDTDCECADVIDVIVGATEDEVTVRYRVTGTGKKRSPRVPKEGQVCCRLLFAPRLAVDFKEAKDLGEDDEM